MFEVEQNPALAAKIYHDPRSTPVRKLELMLANPPNDPMRRRGHCSIAWPVDLLTSGGQVCGFLMPLVRDALPVHQIYNMSARLKACPGFGYRYLVAAAANLAWSVAALHAKGYVIGDLNQSNVLVRSNSYTTLVDADSFQVPDPRLRGFHRCPVFTPDFTPPELQGKDIAGLNRRKEHDQFALGILIFHLLTEGSHPFRARYKGPGDPPSLEVRIRLGMYPYGRRRHSLVELAPGALGCELLTKRVSKLFDRCFVAGHRRPSLRPTAMEWKEALSEMSGSLAACSRSWAHEHPCHLAECIWCRRAIELGQDPFPRIGRPTRIPPTPTMQRRPVSLRPPKHSSATQPQWYKPARIVKPAIVLSALILVCLILNRPSEVTTNLAHGGHAPSAASTRDSRQGNARPVLQGRTRPVWQMPPVTEPDARSVEGATPVPASASELPRSPSTPEPVREAVGGHGDARDRPSTDLASSSTVKTTRSASADQGREKGMTAPDDSADRPPKAGDVLTLRLGQGVRVDFAYVTPGTFVMGSPALDRDRDIDESQQGVTLTDGFYMAVTEVTQRQWQTVMHTDPWHSWFGHNHVVEGDQYPATFIDWSAAEDFCQRMQQTQAASIPQGMLVSLPTEAEWEYACRAGTSTIYCFGNDPSDLAEYAWFDGNAWDRGEQFAHRVGQRRPNGWGLYDMHGNVWEWCLDAVGSGSQRLGDTANPMSRRGSLRSERGGSFRVPARYCRSANRSANDPTDAEDHLGFRPVLVPASMRQ